MKNWREISRWGGTALRRTAIICVVIIGGILLAAAALLLGDMTAAGTKREDDAGLSHYLFWESAGSAENSAGQSDAMSDSKGGGTEKPQSGPNSIDQAVRITYMEGQRAVLASLSDEDLWERFEDAALIGDSRVEGFKIYTQVPRDMVFSKNGATILHMDGVAASVAWASPSRIFIAYGINDIKAGLGGDAEGYAQLAESKIQNLADQVPEAKIYVNSILPASPYKTAMDADYQKVPSYNEALADMCLRNGWNFIDNSEIADEYSSLYVNDGIHLTAGFYRYWAQNMLLTEAMNQWNEGGGRIDAR